MEYNAPKSSSKILTGTICFRYNHSMCVKMRLNKKYFFVHPNKVDFSVVYYTATLKSATKGKIMSDIEKYVEDAINGDSEAFARLYELSKRQVYFTCLKFLKNEDDAQDITQEVYIAVMKKLPTLTDKSSFQPWVNRIAVNKCKNFLKARRDISLDEIQEDDNYPEIPDDDILPEDYVMNAAKRRIVMDIMESVLSDIQYQTVIMFYFNNMSVAEIAEITESPVGTVTYRLNVARAKIKKGVLEYEEKNKDRLHAIVPILPFLTRLLRAEAESIEVPNLMPEISVAEAEIVKAAVDAASAADTAAKSTGFLSTVAGKVTAGVVALAVVGGGVGAGIVMNASNNTTLSTSDTKLTISESIPQASSSEIILANEEKMQYMPLSRATFYGVEASMTINIGDGQYEFRSDMELSELESYILEISGNENIVSDSNHFYFLGDAENGTSFALHVWHNGNVTPSPYIEGTDDTYSICIIPDFRVIDGKPACEYTISYQGETVADTEYINGIFTGNEEIRNDYLTVHKNNNDTLFKDMGIAVIHIGNYHTAEGNMGIMPTIAVLTELDFEHQVQYENKTQIGERIDPPK